MGYLPHGLPSLRRAIARRMSESGIPTDENQILVTNGAQQAITLLAPARRAWQQRGRGNPTYTGALDALRGRWRPAAQGSRSNRRRARPRRCGSSFAANPRLLYLTPTFQNPTGAVRPPGGGSWPRSPQAAAVRQAGAVQIGVPAAVEWPHAWTDASIAVTGDSVTVHAAMRPIPGLWPAARVSTVLDEPSQSWVFTAGRWARALGSLIAVKAVAGVCGRRPSRTTRPSSASGEGTGAGRPGNWRAWPRTDRVQQSGRSRPVDGRFTPPLHAATEATGPPAVVFEQEDLVVGQPTEYLWGDPLVPSRRGVVALDVAPAQVHRESDAGGLVNFTAGRVGEPRNIGSVDLDVTAAQGG